ncbi:hypothetical protein AC249_AIPGENE4452 [Exaiptasia diaphana]|nr:hypothetical protein AC249_AIPGENE4452 [Exaiptasia diaphana]
MRIRSVFLASSVFFLLCLYHFLKTLQDFEKRAYHQKLKQVNINNLETFKHYLKESNIMAIKVNNFSKNENAAINLACASELFVTACPNAGLAAILLYTLEHISFCEKLGALPTIFWRLCGTVCPKDPTINAWEMYFEPVNPKIEEKARAVLCLADPGAPLLKLNKLGIDKGLVNVWKERMIMSNLVNLSFRKRTAIGFNGLGIITRAVQTQTNQLIQKYVKLQPKIQKMVDQFYSRYLDKYHVVAVHVRGTDHGLETDNGRLVPLNAYIQNIKDFLHNKPTINRIFVASDNLESIKTFVKEFGSKILKPDFTSTKPEKKLRKEVPRNISLEEQEDVKDQAHSFNCFLQNRRPRGLPETAAEDKISESNKEITRKRSHLLVHMAHKMNLDGEGLRHIRKHLIDIAGHGHMVDDIIDIQDGDNMKGIFYFFRLHDSDNNEKLDGLEWLKALTHFDDKESIDTSEGSEQNFDESEAITIIDELLAKHDNNNDGMIDFLELMNTKVDSILNEMNKDTDDTEQQRQQEQQQQEQQDQQKQEQQEQHDQQKQEEQDGQQNHQQNDQRKQEEQQKEQHKQNEQTNEEQQDKQQQEQQHEKQWQQQEQQQQLQQQQEQHQQQQQQQEQLPQEEQEQQS